MIQFSGQLVAVKLNAEREGRAVAMKYRVSGFPTVLYLDADGGEWGRMPGFLPAPEFLQLAGDALKQYKGQPALEAKLKQRRWVVPVDPPGNPSDGGWSGSSP